MVDFWTNFSDLPTYITDAFSAIDPWFYPLIFIGIIGFLYTSMHSVTVAAVGILVTFGIFATTTSIFADIPQFSIFLYIITIIGIPLLIGTIFINRRQ